MDLVKVDNLPLRRAIFWQRLAAPKQMGRTNTVGPAQIRNGAVGRLPFFASPRAALPKKPAISRARTRSHGFFPGCRGILGRCRACIASLQQYENIVEERLFLRALPSKGHQPAAWTRP
jgi:hypothetical protein